MSHVCTWCCPCRAGNGDGAGLSHLPCVVCRSHSWGLLATEAPAGLGCAGPSCTGALPSKAVLQSTRCCHNILCTMSTSLYVLCW